MTCLRSYKDRDVSPENSDIILSKGELLSSRMIYEIFKKSGFSIAYADPRDLLITDSNFGEANPDINRTKNEVGRQTRELFKNNMHIITGGFVGSDPENKTTTIGRGGSDYSAAIFAAALNARELQIWTDVDGMMTCDPRIIPNAKLIKEITYREAAELAFFGAKVLHPKTIYPAIEKNIPVYILNSFKPDLAGTLISGDVHGDAKVKSLAFRRGISAINIHSNRMLGAYGFLAKTFEIFKKHKTSVDIIATSEVNISLTLDNSQNLNFLNDDLREFAGVDVLNNMAIVTLVGEGIRDTAGISARFFGALKGIVIRMVSIGASEVNISIVINEENLQYALEALHSEFFE
jgi:aspartate kinase